MKVFNCCSNKGVLNSLAYLQLEVGPNFDSTNFLDSHFKEHVAVGKKTELELKDSKNKPGNSENAVETQSILSLSRIPPDNKYYCRLCKSLINGGKYRAKEIRGLNEFANHMRDIHQTLVIVESHLRNGKPTDVYFSKCLAPTQVDDEVTILDKAAGPSVVLKNDTKIIPSKLQIPKRKQTQKSMSISKKIQKRKKRRTILSRLLFQRYRKPKSGIILTKDKEVQTETCTQNNSDQEISPIVPNEFEQPKEIESNLKDPIPADNSEEIQTDDQGNKIVGSFIVGDDFPSSETVWYTNLPMQTLTCNLVVSKLTVQKTTESPISESPNVIQTKDKNIHKNLTNNLPPLPEIVNLITKSVDEQKKTQSLANSQPHDEELENFSNKKIDQVVINLEEQDNNETQVLKTTNNESVSIASTSEIPESDTSSTGTEPVLPIKSKPALNITDEEENEKKSTPLEKSTKTKTKGASYSDDSDYKPNQALVKTKLPIPRKNPPRATKEKKLTEESKPQKRCVSTTEESESEQEESFPQVKKQKTKTEDTRKSPRILSKIAKENGRPTRSCNLKEIETKSYFKKLRKQ